MHINTVILLGNFSIGLINFVNFLTFFIQRFLTSFKFFKNKNALFNVFFILGVNVLFYIHAL